jgi:hypothetical protein
MYEKFKFNDEYAHIQIDIKNAFNCLYRKWMRTTLIKFAPDLIYTKHSKIYYSENHILQSTRGYQQGDGLAAFGFALALYHKFSTNKAIPATFFNIWYHDDSNAVEKIQFADIVINNVRQACQEIGLQINNHKTNIYVDKSQSTYKFENEVNVVPEKNFEILGSFIGDNDYIKNKLTTVLLHDNNGCLSIQSLLNTIKRIDDKHIAWAYTYYCANYSKIMHLLRTIPHNLTIDFCEKFDELILDAFQHLIESPIDSTAYNQIVLNLKNGGIGLRATKHHSIAASISSFFQCKNRLKELFTNRNQYIFFHNVKDNICEHTHGFNELIEEYISTGQALQAEYNIPEEIDMFDQRYLSTLIDNSKFQNWYQTLDIYTRTRLNACRATGASSWIGSIPIYSSHFNNNEWMITMRLWLGLKLFQQREQIYKCIQCNKELDEYGYHMIKCNRTNGISHGLTIRHNITRDILYQYCRKANYTTEKEKWNLCADQSKPADVYIHTYNNNKACYIDVGITSPIQDKFFTNEIEDILIAANSYEQFKIHKYENKIELLEVDFIPFICEAFGGIGHYAYTVIKRISWDLQSILHNPYYIIVNQLKRDIVMAVWKSNAKMINDRLPSMMI